MHVKPEKHIKRYKEIRRTIDLLLSQPDEERDAATITTAVHWASFHLVSAIIDNLQIPERWKHRNHRSVKYALKDSGEIIAILGERAEYIT